MHRAPCSQDVEADVHKVPQATFNLQQSEIAPPGLPDPMAPAGGETVRRKGHEVK